MRPLCTNSIMLGQKCSHCNDWAAQIEIVAPNSFPEGALSWSKEEVASYKKFRDFDQYYVVYSGPGGSSGTMGSPIDENKKTQLIDTFTEPFDPVKLKEQFYDMAGFCADCEKFYCGTHWNTSIHGYGKCPQGHGKSLDPHWSPNME